MRKLLVILFALGASLCSVAYASSGTAAKEIDIDESLDAIKKGAYVAIETCSLCHGIKYLKYRDLAQIGFDTNEITQLRADRSADDVVSARFTEENSMKSFGMIPPDLSVMAKRTKYGARHIYMVLTSYHEDEKGKIENSYIQGIRMPDVLGMSVEIDPARKQLLDERAKNVSSFLLWMADPHAAERKRMGFWVMGYLVVLTILLYLVKRRVWSRLG